MNLRKILSIAIAVCMITVQMAVCAFAEEIPAETIPTEAVEETVQQEEAKAETEEVTETEEAKAPADIVLTAELDDVVVTLKATADAFENKGELSLVVKPVEIEDTEEEAALDAIEKENVAKRVTYDITVLDDETEIEPVKEVKVSFVLKDAPSGADKANIYHHDEEKGIEKIATEVLTDSSKAETAVINKTEDNDEGPTDEELEALDDVAIINDVTVDGFSLYTVDFTYKDKTISIAGDSTGNKLDDIVNQLGITEKVEEATTYQDADCTKEVASGEVKNNAGDTLFSVYESGDSWYVDAVNAFQTEHGLVVKTADGAEYKIKVTDDDAGPKFYAVFNTAAEGNKPANTLSFYYDANSGSHKLGTETVYHTLPTAATYATDWGYNDIRENVKNVVIDASVANYSGLKSTAEMFAQMNNADNISGCEYLNTSDVKNMSCMFAYYGNASTSITVVPNVSNWNTSNVKNMNSMFSDYGSASTSITAVPNVSNWNTSNVENMRYMFAAYAYKSTSKLQPLDLSGWNISKLTVASYMFKNYAAANNSGDPVVYATDWSTIKSSGVTATQMFSGSKLKNAPAATATDDQWSYANTSATGCFTVKPNPTPTPTPAPSQQRSTSSTGTWSSTPVKVGSATAPISNGSWKLVNGSFQYKVDGDSLKNSTAWISYTGTDGKPYSGCFYFDTNGMMATGWKKIDGTWFYFDPEEGQKKGMMKTTGWVNYDGKQYFLGADGKMLVNTTTPDGKKVDAEGALIK